MASPDRWVIRLVDDSVCEDLSDAAVACKIGVDGNDLVIADIFAAYCTLHRRQDGLADW